MGGELANVARGFVSVALGAAALVVLAPLGLSTASAEIVQDASCSGPIGQNSGADQVAQTFTARNSGVLVQADPVILMADGLDIPHVFQIRAVSATGVPGDQVLATESLSQDEVLAMVPLYQAGKVPVSFTSPARVRAGQTYALVYFRGMPAAQPFAVWTTTSCAGSFFYQLDSAPFQHHPGDGDWIFSTSVSTDTCGGEVPTIAGSSEDDTLRGTRQADVILGFGGEDTIHGLGGADVICGGGGDDTLTASGGADTLKGGNGKDALKAGKGRDTLFGQNGKDRHHGGPGKDRLRGGKGDDRCRGDGGRDKLRSC